MSVFWKKNLNLGHFWGHLRLICMILMGDGLSMGMRASVCSMICACSVYKVVLYSGHVAILRIRKWKRGKCDFGEKR